MFFKKLLFIFSVLAVSNVSAQQCIDLFESAGMSLDSNQKLSKSNKKKYSKAEKKKISQDFLQSFYKKDKPSMRRLVLKHPFLKAIRMPVPTSVLQSRSCYDCFDLDIGWTPLQMASYNKDLDLLEFLLELDFEYKTKKGKGAVSLEYNPLHIAIITDFFEGAKSILLKSGLEKFGRHKGRRFIDEKTGDKMTPWALAVFQDLKNKRVEFVHLIGSYEPSGYVESSVLKQPIDGYVVAQEYGGRGMYRLAKKYLKAPNYEKYMNIKEKSVRDKRKRTKPRSM